MVVSQGEWVVKAEILSRCTEEGKLDWADRLSIIALPVDGEGLDMTGKDVTARSEDSSQKLCERHWKQAGSLV